MYYVKIFNQKAVEATTESQSTYQRRPAPDGSFYETRSDWPTFSRVEEVAAQLTESLKATWIATDAGPHTYPRYDVIRPPRVGDAVSYSFNGDTYPCGTITSISKSLKVIKTTEGRTFYRRRLTGSWISKGTWFLVGGHHYEQNPSF